MSLENDTLTQAAVQFTQAVKAERDATASELEKERQATLAVLKALQTENEYRRRSIVGRFFMGLLLGGLAGTAVAIAVTPVSGIIARQNLGARLKVALEAGRSAAVAREQELWTDLRKRLNESGGKA